MDVLFRSIGENMLDSNSLYAVHDSLQACDAAESNLTLASHFVDPPYAESRAGSRAATPMLVRNQHPVIPFVNSPSIKRQMCLPGKVPGAFPHETASSSKSVRLVSEAQETLRQKEH